MNGPCMTKNGCWHDSTHVGLGGFDGDVKQS
jgi:hypothetical protein